MTPNYEPHIAEINKLLGVEATFDFADYGVNFGIRVMATLSPLSGGMAEIPHDPKAAFLHGMIFATTLIKLHREELWKENKTVP